MNIDISNAHCGPRIRFPDHAWLRVVQQTKPDCSYPRSRTLLCANAGEKERKPERSSRSRAASFETKRDLSMMKNDDDLENLNISFFTIPLCVLCVISKANFIEKRDSRITVHRAQKVESRSSIFFENDERTDVRASIVLYSRERERTLTVGR